ncbi:MAG: hypothetical protein ACYDA9_02060 [Terriglobia bacterium]
MKRLATVLVAFITLLGPRSTPLTAQDAPEFEIGLKPYGTFHGGDIDSVSLTNGNLTVHASLWSNSQRGGKLTKALTILYNNKGWYLKTTCSRLGGCIQSWRWRGSGVSVGDLQSINAGGGTSCQLHEPGYSVINLPITSVVTGDGSTHVMAALAGSGSGSESIDGSGIHGDSTGNYDRNGTRYTPASAGPIPREDPNGNQISVDANTLTTTDTLGRQYPYPTSTTDYSGCPNTPLPVSSATVLSVPGPNGGTATIKTCSVTVSLHTSFPDGDYQYSGNYSMIQTIVLPNGQAWNFQYDNGITVT